MENKSNFLLTTIVESRHHAITPSLYQMGGGGAGGGGEGASGKGLQFLNIENGKDSIESGKFLRRKRNEGVFNDISPSF